jgi:beta-lactamase superfamily II metal-dependent hydrolase
VLGRSPPSARQIGPEVRVILFDVGQGFCCFLKPRTGATLMIDCSGSAKFSPVKYIIENELNGVVPIAGKYFLTRLIVTHPHDDHIKDISRVIADLPPYILTRSTYSWDHVKSPDKDADEYESLDTYTAWQAGYNSPVTHAPNWGRMAIETFRVPQVLVPGSNNGKAVNNSSFAVIVTFSGSIHKHKFLFGGDLEQSGWESLLKQNEFRAAVQGVTFYFASHHGHVSGFSTELFNAMGQKPYLNLISATSCYDSHDSRYSANARGLYFGQNQRFTLTTRTDGSIFIDVDDTGLATVNTYCLLDNLEPEVPDYVASFLKSFNLPSGPR